MKSKAVFLGTYENINRIYGEDTRQKLFEILDILPDFYTEEILKNGESHTKLSEVEYAFSTWGMAQLNEDEIKALFPKLKAVFYAAGSVQEFARPFLNCGVRVFSAWAANAVPVAEYTVSQIVLANKGFFKTSVLASAGKRLEACEIFEKYSGNYGVKVGIIGAGMVGKLVIKMLKGYEAEVFVFDPFLSDRDACELGVKKVSLEKIFSQCNVVSNHLANNEQTKGILNGKLFEKMPKYSTFINTGRGAQVVESDLIDILKKRSDLTAILDVTYPEPPENNSEMYKLSNCLLTPHIAGSSGNEVKRMSVYMLDEFKRLINNEPTKYEVTTQMLKTMA